MAVIAWIWPDISSIATTPCTRPSSTSSRVTNHSSYRVTLSYFSDVWNSVCSMWKPVLSAANQVRIFFMPPKARTAMCPSGCRLQGQPQCSSCSSSRGGLLDERLDRVLVTQPVAAGDGVVGVLVEAVVGSAMTPAAPPSADTVWLRIG